MTVIRF